MLKANITPDNDRRHPNDDPDGTGIPWEPHENGRNPNNDDPDGTGIPGESDGNNLEDDYN